MNFPEHDRRIALALAGSALLHAALILGPLVRWQSGSGETPLPPSSMMSAHLAAPVKPASPAAAQPPKAPTPTPMPDTRQNESRLLTGKGNFAVAAAADPTPLPEQEQGPREPIPDNLPLATNAAPLPEYPPAAFRQRIEGCVLAAVTVDTEGRVERVDVLATDHPGVFDAAVTKAQGDASYLPGILGGKPVRSEVLTIVEFRLPGSAPLDCALRHAERARRWNGAVPVAGR